MLTLLPIPQIIMINSLGEAGVQVNNVTKNTNSNATSRPLARSNAMPISYGVGWSTFLNVVGTDNSQAFRMDAYNNGEVIKMAGLLTTNIFFDLKEDTDSGILPLQDGVHLLGTASYSWKSVDALTYNVNGAAGQTGSFTSNDGKTITVTGGVITGIV